MSTEPANSQTLSSKLPPLRGTVSLVIVVWNAKRYVQECLESLREHCQDVYDEVIVVDNASTDGSPELIAETFPEFRLIRNSENLGFAKANNIGIAQCSGDYVCLVNSDVKFTGDCLSPMLQYLSENPGVGMVGPKMLGRNGKVWRSTMRFPTVWNQFCRALGLDVAFKHSQLFGGYLMSDFDHETTTPVEVLNGWFVLVRRSALDRVGLLDPQFFMYGEDVDWCYRFHEAGEKIIFFAESEAIHYGDECWSKVLVGWKNWKDEGLTQHRNWWPDLYRAYCQHKGITPDPKIEAYGDSYEGKRADLKNYAVST